VLVTPKPLNIQPVATGQKGYTPMTSILNFESEVYSEELFAGISEADYNEVMQASAVDDNDISAELEHQAWQGSKQFSGILIKKACEHTSCPHTRCARSLRIGGIEI
jgi:hypothetical protein